MIERTITGFDIAQRFATSEEDYVFTNSSLSSILTRVLDDFQVPAGSITTTGKTLGQIVSRGRTLWDLLQEAVQRHKDQTGEVFRIYAEGGRVHMKLQGDQSRWWVYEYGESFENFRRTRSVREMINHVKIYGVFEGDTDKPSVEATRSNEESKSLYGLRQKVEYIGSAEDESRVVNLAEKTLDRYAAPDEQVEITGWLIPNLRAGEQIRFIDDELGLNRLYFVETLDASWTPDKADTIATVRREAVDPDLILEEVSVA